MQSTDYRELLTLRPKSEYHEDMGDVLWWSAPFDEAPYVGTPNDMGYVVEFNVRSSDRAFQPAQHEYIVGGWPGYHTHWSPIPMVCTPADMMSPEHRTEKDG